MNPSAPNSHFPAYSSNHSTFIPGFEDEHGDPTSSSDLLPSSEIPSYLLDLASEEAEDEAGSGQTKETQQLHFKVMRFVFHSADKLHAKPITLGCACHIYHTIYTLCTPEQYDPYLIATTSLYLAGKVEENHLRLRDVINVCYSTLHPDRPPLDIGKTYWSLRETVVHCELFIMRLLKFKVSFDHPHRHLLHFIKSVQDLLTPQVVERTPIATMAWALLRDSYHGNICLHHPPEHLAVCCLYLALEMLGVDVPLNNQGESTWWNALVEGIRLSDVRNTVKHIVAIYRLEVETT